MGGRVSGWDNGCEGVGVCGQCARVHHAHAPCPFCPQTMHMLRIICLASHVALHPQQIKGSIEV